MHFPAPIIWISLLPLLVWACSEPQESSRKTVSKQSSVEQLEYPPLPRSLEKYHRELEKSWNLVSLPIMTEMPVESFMELHESIQSIWWWEPEGKVWQRFPKAGNFVEIETLHPEEGYWVQSEKTMTLSGAGKAIENYEFSEGWNLRAYSHSADSIPVSQFFAQGDYWKNACGGPEPISNVWAWIDQNWKLYFPNDADRIQFNEAHKTNFPAFTTLEPGMAFWVNAAQGTSPTSEHDCPIEVPDSLIGVQTFDLGTKTSFLLPEDTISFLITAWGTPSDEEFLKIQSIESPSGNNPDPTGNLVWDTSGFSSFFNPIVPGMSREAGKWKFAASAPENTEFKLTVRRGNWTETPTLAVQPFYASPLWTAADIDAALLIFEKLYEDNGIQIDLRPTITIEEERFRYASLDFNIEHNVELISKGATDAVNLFFVEDLSRSSSIFGIAPGAPGAMGIRGGRNGVLIALLAHASGNNVINNQLLAETAAHEMGHHLGLSHTSSSNGKFHDPLDDTPECTASTTSPTGCPDGRNIMFWTGQAGWEQKELSGHQIQVIQHSPLAY